MIIGRCTANDWVWDSGCNEGRRRREHHIKANTFSRAHRPMNGFDGTLDASMKREMRAAVAEAVFAYFTGLPWTGKGEEGRDKRDVDPFEIRYTPKMSNRLWLKGSDKPDAYYVLISDGDHEREFVIRGWMLGRDAMIRDHWEDPRGENEYAFYVPNDKLITELPVLT